jgi:D-sedoheptulose 7-phosphate isomerase
VLKYNYEEHLACFKHILEIEATITTVGKILLKTIMSSHKILICGNGGSAADSQHFAAEIVGRFQKERKAWPAVALTTDTSVMTAIANDYEYKDIFARQVEGIGQAGDVFIGVSTSGNSENISAAVTKSNAMGIQTIGLLGRDGGVLKEEVDFPVIVPHTVTARIQEAHIFILHFWAEQIEEGVLENARTPRS